MALVLLSLFMVGCANEADKRIETAKDLYRQSVAHRDKGETVKEEIALEEALGEFRRISRDYPNRSMQIEGYLYQIWEENYKQTNYEAASSLIVETLVKNFPESVWISSVRDKLLLIALEYEKKDRYEAARHAYQEFIDKFPKDEAITLALRGLGQVNYQLKDYENARKIFREFLGRHSKVRILGECIRFYGCSAFDCTVIP